MNPALEVLKAFRETADVAIDIWDVVRKRPKPVLLLVVLATLGWGYQWAAFDRPGFVIREWIVDIEDRRFKSALELVDPSYRKARGWTPERFENLFHAHKSITNIEVEYQGSRWILWHPLVGSDLTYKTTYEVIEKVPRDLIFDEQGTVRRSYQEVSRWLEIRDPAEFDSFASGKTESMTLARRFSQIFIVSNVDGDWRIAEIKNLERALLNPEAFYERTSEAAMTGSGS